MVQDAETHAADDKKRREVIDQRNQAENLVYETEKNMKEWGDKLDADDRSKLEKALARTREQLGSESAETIRAAVEELQKELHQVAAKMYQHAGAEGQAPGAGPQTPPSGGKASGGRRGDAVDADYEVVDEDKGS
jgi:molecular chaperone DnaK